MNLLHQILTILFWLALAFGGFRVLQSFSTNVPFSVLIGYAIGNLLLPAILWLAKYYIGKNISENESNSGSNEKVNDENMA